MDPEVQRRLMQMSDHGQSSSFLVVEFTTYIAIVMQVAMIISEGPIVRVFVSIIMLYLISLPSQEHHSHLGLRRKVFCDVDVFFRQQPRSYPHRDRRGSSGDVRVIGWQLRRVRSVSAHSPAVESRRYAKLCGNNVLNI